MKTLYEKVAVANKGKFENLKKDLEDLQARTRLNTDITHILLQTKQERFTAQLHTYMEN